MNDQMEEWQRQTVTAYFCYDKALQHKASMLHLCMQRMLRSNNMYGQMPECTSIHVSKKGTDIIDQINVHQH